jgi:hypothetical protein
MRILHILPCLAVLASSARADNLNGNSYDSGRVTGVQKGVWEIDLGGLAVLSSDQVNDTSVTRISTDFSAAVSYFIRKNVSVGVAALADWTQDGDGTEARTFGAALQGALHLRLGLGAFFRPGLGVGVLFGTRTMPAAPGMLVDADQVGVIARLQLPIAYYATTRVLLQAGPQFDLTAGSYSVAGGMSQSFTRTAGGFAVGVGYAF